MKKIFCIGELLIDFVAERQGNDLSVAAEFTKKAGGAPANVACAIARLGGDSAFIGCVGEDPFGTFLIRVLMESGVDTSQVQRSATFTTLAFVSLAPDGERDFIFSRGADRELEYQPGIREGFAGNMIHLGAATAMLGGALENSYQRYLDDGVAEKAFVSFDPNFRGDLWQGREAVFIKKCLPYIAKADLCKFSLEEAYLLSGKSGLPDACTFLHNLGTRIITITLGPEGTYVSTRGTSFTVPSIRVKAIDTTGAGDAFIGCLLHQISALETTVNLFKEDALLAAMVLKANKAGAFTTTHFGAIDSLPGQKELDDL